MPVSKIDRATASGTTAFTMNLIGLNSTDIRPSFLKPTSLAARALAPSSPADIAKYVGIAIGAVFFLALISSVFAVYRRRRRYARKRPRGSIYIETTQPSSGQPESPPQRHSMAQPLTQSRPNSSFEASAYALSNTPPPRTTSPEPMFWNGNQQAHPDLVPNRARGFSPSSPIPIRPIPRTPFTRYTAVHEGDPRVSPGVVPQEHPPFTVSWLGSGTHAELST